MKKLILSLIAVFIFSFSFSQSKTVEKKEPQLNSKKAIEYLKKELRLKGSKLKTVEDAYNKYVINMVKLNEQIAMKDKSSAGNSEALVSNKQAKFKMMNAFLKERDAAATKGFSKGELGKYQKFSRAIHPFTLQVKPAKKK